MEKEKDLMAKDVLQMMMKLVIALVVSLLLIIGAFIGYAVYKDKQFTDFVDSFEYEMVEIDAAQDGQGVNIVGGGDVDNGANSKDSKSQN